MGFALVRRWGVVVEVDAEDFRGFGAAGVESVDEDGS